MLIGIFWIYKQTVIGRAIDVSKGDESVPGLIDSPDTHSDYWQEANPFLRFSELRSREYFDVPRGRVLHDRNQNTAIVYLDKVLQTPKGQALVADFFELDEETTSWCSDAHYTTDPEEIERLLED